MNDWTVVDFLTNPYDDDANGVNPQTSDTENKILRTELNYSPDNILWKGENEEGIDFQHCTWFIYPKDKQTKIKIKFNYFDIYKEVDSDCGDILEINGKKLCGNEENIDMVQYFTSYPLKVQFQVYTGTAD